MAGKILTVQVKKEDKFLREKTKEFKFFKKSAQAAGRELSFKEIDELLREMRRTMREARGVGLSANQIGLPYRLFVAEVPDAQGSVKFYAVFNPRLEFPKKEKAVMEEGCLSVPGKYGFVERVTSVKLNGVDKRGRAVKIKAWGLLAHVFQHEVDHLEGKLFIDKAKEIFDVPRSERLIKKESDLK
ncbi:MAG: peptide deformylase [Candidatus Liptonbacteria bacterium]|nr:peptide deformylase [Candidatus Liptonbacteria bacterium]